MSKVFMSYSRKQFYFAESLALSLRAQRHRVWMDLYQIMPGTDWAAAISQGLQGCDVFVLVASRDAFQSPHVTAEWQSALARQIPIYLVLFESVDIPAPLRNVALVDLRKNFVKKAEYLGNLMHQRAGVRESLPARNTSTLADLSFSLRLPVYLLPILAVLYVAVYILEWFLIPYDPTKKIPDPIQQSSLYSAIYTIERSVFTTITVGFAVFYGLNVLWRYYRRKPYAFYSLVGLSLFSGPGIAYFLISVLGGLTIIFGTIQALPLIVLTLAVFLTILIGLVITGFSVFYCIRELTTTSGTLLRWLPTGSAPEWLRRRANGRWIREIWHLEQGGSNQSGQIPIIPRQFHIRFHPADRRVARQLSTILTKAGYQAVEVPGVGAAELFILSRRTPFSWFQEYLKTLSRTAICIIASTITLPDDFVAGYRSQWIDFRSRSPKLFMASWENTFRSNRSQFRLPILPERIDTYTIPGNLLTPFYYMLSFGAFILFIVLRILLLAPLLNPSDPFIIPISLIAIVGVIYFLWIIIRIMVGDITFWGAVVQWVVALFMLGIVFALLSSNYAMIFQYIGLLSTIILFIPIRALYRWLPQRRTQRLSRAERTMAPSALSLTRGWLLLFIFMALSFETYSFTPYIPLTDVSPTYTSIAPGAVCVQRLGSLDNGSWGDNLSGTKDLALSCSESGLSINEPALTQTDIQESDVALFTFFGLRGILPITFPRAYKAKIHVSLFGGEPGSIFLGFGYGVNAGDGQLLTLVNNGQWQTQKVSTSSALQLGEGYIATLPQSFEVTTPHA